jgi:hypothetical protein
MKRKMFLAAFMLVSSAAAYLTWDYMTVDRCLDGGGAWDDAAETCRY